MDSDYHIKRIISHRRFPPLIAMVLTVLVYIPVFVFLTREASHPNGFNARHTYPFPVYGSDSQEYALLADHMRVSHVFSLSTNPPLIPETFRAPGYPFFLALVRTLMSSWIIVSLVQIVLTGFTAALICLLGTRMGSRWIGAGAAAWYIFDPSVAMHAMILMSESLFITILCLAVYTTLHAKEKQRSVWAFPAGVLFGMAALIRPVGLYAAVPALVWLAYHGYRRRRVVLSYATLFIVGMGLFLLPWWVRNKEVSGTGALSSVSAYNLLLYNVAHFESATTGHSLAVVRQQLLAQAGVNEQEARRLEYSPKIMDVARTHLKGRWAQYLVFHMVKTVPFFLGSSLAQWETYWFEVVNGRDRIGVNVNLSDLLFHRSFTSLLAVVYARPWFLTEIVVRIAILVSALAGMLLVRTPRREVLYWYLAMVGVFAILTGIVSNPRYRIVAQPFLLIAAMTGIREMGRRDALSRIKFRIKKTVRLVRDNLHQRV